MKLLLHTCCGPCASATIPLWTRRGAEVTGFFFNPNIHPLLEWRRRATGAQDVAVVTGIHMLEDPAYDPAAWFASVFPQTMGAPGDIPVRIGMPEHTVGPAADRLDGPAAEPAPLPRCFRCIGQRLMRTAEEAAARGYDAFSTTLSISPYQDHHAIRKTGAVAAERHRVEFLYEDLRPLYGESRRSSREWGIYRQKYCGCLMSEWERYRGS